MPGAEQNSLHQIINNVLPINAAPGKDAITQTRPYPQIWTENVKDDEFNEDTTDPSIPESEEQHHDLEYHGPQNAEMVSGIAKWLHDIQVHGFPPQVLLNHLRPEVDLEEEGHNWDKDKVRVFLPYYDLEPDDIKEVEGRVNPKNNEPMGRCTLKLHNGDEITGSFRPERTLSGNATAQGPNMEAHGLSVVSGFHQDGILHGKGRALLRARSLWPSIDRQISLEGIFNDSYLEGPVRGAYKVMMIGRREKEGRRR